VQVTGHRPAYLRSTNHPTTLLENKKPQATTTETNLHTKENPTHRNHQVEENTDKVKPDKQHRDHRWINKMEDGLHPYPAEMIKNSAFHEDSD